MPFAMTQVDLEVTMLSERERQIWYHVYVKSKKIQQTSEYNKKANSQTYRKQISSHQWGGGGA